MPRGSEVRGLPPPGSYEELRAVLASGGARLPKRLRQVAIYLWQQPTEVALGTVTSTAASCGVQPSTLVRFAQNLGFRGFSELQEVFKDHVKGARPDLASRAAGAADADRHLVLGFVDAARSSLLRAADVDGQRFALAATTVAAGETIYLVGSKRAFPATTYLSIALTTLGLRNLLVDNVGSNAFEQLGWAGPHDVVLAVSFSPYNSITPDLVAAAHGRGVPVVALTDSALSPLVPAAAAWLEVVEDPFAGFRSPAATIAVGMALVLAVAARRAPPVATAPRRRHGRNGTKVLDSGKQND